jgi:hypothetical protein
LRDEFAAIGAPLWTRLASTAPELLKKSLSLYRDLTEYDRFWAQRLAGDSSSFTGSSRSAGETLSPIGDDIAGEPPMPARDPSALGPSPGASVGDRDGVQPAPASRDVEPYREGPPAWYRVPHSGRDHGQPIEVHTLIYIDGMKIGHAVTRHEGDHSPTARGTRPATLK